MGISVGLVGLGQFGSRFADLFAAHPLVNRVALCDQDPARIEPFSRKSSWQGKFREADGYTDFADILGGDLDALAVFTQPWLHAEQCVAALEAGKSVYSAVPTAQTPDPDEVLEACDRLVGAVERSGRQYMLGETTWYRPQTMFCRRQARAGAFGEFVYAEGEYYHGFDDPACDLRTVMRARLSSPAGRAWRARLDDYRRRGVGMGPMLYPTHSVSGPMSVMRARALDVRCIGQVPVTDDSFFDWMNYTFSNQTALFRMSNGAVMRICEHRETASHGEQFSLHGTRGTFLTPDCWREGREPGRLRTLTVEEMRDPLPEAVAEAFRAACGEEYLGGHGGSHGYLVHEFVDAVAGRRVPAVNVWQAARFMAAGVAAHRSALRDGERVEVADWGDGPGLTERQVDPAR
jgi:predicted dehydrogenase